MRDSPFELERLMGMKAYLTDAEGLGGRLRCDIPDFIVREVSDVQAGATGDHLIVRVEKRVTYRGTVSNLQPVERR
jgi:tRNA pseudouridine13 synthase